MGLYYDDGPMMRGCFRVWGTPVHASDICLTSCMNLIPTVILRDTHDKELSAVIRISVIHDRA